jgi:hypothetical protein
VKTNAVEGTTKGLFPEPQPFSRWLRIGFWVCIVISVAAVLRRIVALARPTQSAPPQLAHSQHVRPISSKEGPTVFAEPKHHQPIKKPMGW